MFRNFWEASESPSACEPREYQWHTDGRADNSLREEYTYLIGSRGKIVRVALSYNMICFWRVT